MSCFTFHSSYYIRHRVTASNPSPSQHLQHIADSKKAFIADLSHQELLLRANGEFFATLVVLWMKRIWPFPNIRRTERQGEITLKQ
eukprot:scaffold1400_cov137-Cylindrotheca_fusiformis.AAC.15